MFGFLKKYSSEKHEEQNRAFKEKYSQFRELLDRNHEVLETITELSVIKEKRTWISLVRIRSKGDFVSAEGNGLTGRRLERVAGFREGIRQQRAKVCSRLASRRARERSGLVIELPHDSSRTRGHRRIHP